MRVLHLFNEINFSGAEIMYANAANTFQKDGIELIAISTGESIGNFVSQFEKVNIKVVHKPINFNFFSVKGFSYYKELYLFIKAEDIAVLHIHRSNLYFAAFIAWVAGIRCVKTQHNTFRNNSLTLPYQILIRFILRNIFKVTFHTIGESVFSNEQNRYKNPSVRVNNWFDEKKFYPALYEKEDVHTRHNLSIPKDAFVIISTGSCSNIKNHFDIIKALALVKQKINCFYLHLGHGLTEPQEVELSKELKVFDSIRYLGNNENVRDYLIAADVFVMSSKFEGLSIASIEAMACKIPSILYNAPGLCDLIRDDDNGFLIAPNFNLLAERIIYYQQNPLIAKQKAEAAFLNVQKEYSMSSNIQKIISLYNYEKELVLQL